jgi:alkylated DNA repair dioxygenase AlkB
LDYQHDFFRGQRLKRGYAQLGYAYLSTGRKAEVAAELPEFLTAVSAKALGCCPAGTTFNQCIVSRYPVCAGIGWHSDAGVFGDCIVGVSLGGLGRFQFQCKDSDDVMFEVELLPGSMYMVYGPSRWDHKHRVVPVRAERYSLTSRSARLS